MADFHKEDFARILAERNVILTDLQTRQFALYCDMLREWNERMNLTAICEEDAIYEKHFLDCVLPMLEYQPKGSLCDVGAGAGFPSLPMKIMDPTLQVTIIEPIQKRITFLRALCEACQLDVTLVHGRSEEYAKHHRESFDIVSARAVASLPVLSELCIPLIKVKGQFWAMKGSRAHEEKEMAKQAIARLGCRYLTSSEQMMSDGAAHITLIYEKIKSTPVQYPRSYGQIKKHPL